MDLATEIFQDLKKEARRKQIVIYALIGVIVFLIFLGVIERAMWDYSTVLVDAENGNIVNGQDYSSNEKDQESATWTEKETSD